MSPRRVPGLGPAARELIEAARPGEVPRAGERERIRAALLAKLPPAGLSSGEPSPGDRSPGDQVPSPPAAPSPGLGGLSSSASSALIRWLLVIGGATGAGALAWSADGDATQPPAHVAAPPRVVAAPARPPEPLPAATPPGGGVAPPDVMGAIASPAAVAGSTTPGAIARQGPHAPAPAGHLAQELALLDQAQRALAAGDATAALAAIEDHEQRHPGGKLEEEREAARVLALCAAGALPQANEVAERFFERWPASTLGGRVRASCVGR